MMKSFNCDTDTIQIPKPIQAMNRADLATFIRSEYLELQNEILDTDVARLEVIPGEAVKITISEHLPRMEIYSRVVFINNKPFYKAYAAARKRWYGLTYRALQDYSEDPITPGLLYVVYYTPYICDFDNYSVKFIMDALRYGGVLEKDDLRYVQEGIRKMVVDGNNPRTEIYVLIDDHHIEKRLNKYDKLLQMKGKQNK